MFSVCVNAQNTFYYQSVLRNSDGSAIGNKDVKVRFNICKDNDGNAVYSETHQGRTNAEGYINLYIGAGQAVNGVFSKIDWSEGSYSVKTEIDKGEGYAYSSKQELSTVPYAMYAEATIGLQKKANDGTTWNLTIDNTGKLSTQKDETQIISIPNGYSKLVFNDEFNGTGLPDAGKWGYEEGYVRGHEQQYYTVAREENCYQKDGYLHLVCENKPVEIKNALVNNRSENDWTERRKDTIISLTSACVTTQESHAWKYCRVDVRAKLPMCKGTWPAIWMLPKDSNYGRGWWPDTGEIDIMEHVGYAPNDVHYTAHCNTYNSGTYPNPYNRSTACPTSYTEYHIYTLEWTETRMAWYLDGSLKFFVNRPSNHSWKNWPFDKSFYLLLNQAFGGDWGGQKGVDLNGLPQDYMIDYVRVYQ